MLDRLSEKLRCPVTLINVNLFFELRVAEQVLTVARILTVNHQFLQVLNVAPLKLHVSHWFFKKRAKKGSEPLKLKQLRVFKMLVLYQVQ